MNTHLVILANSYRPGDRCIAGIDINTGKWIRPVSENGGAVSQQIRIIDDMEPALLDVIEMSLQGDGPDVGCQPENRTVNSIPWRKVGTLTTRQVLKYCEDDTLILHNDDDCVIAKYFTTIPKSKWKSLQLVRPAKVDFTYRILKSRKQRRVLFQFGQAKSLNLGLTDPILIERLQRGEKIKQDCLLTISLAGPYVPEHSSQPERCYKLVAGMIEI